MKHRARHALGALLALAVAPLSAQPKPALSSPDIAADGHVTFRIAARAAHAVTLNLETTGDEKKPMQQGADGVWSVTVGPLAPDLYSYSFTVDGLQTLDPANAETIRAGSRYANLLAVPGAEMPPWMFADVPHGTVQAVWYPSPTLHATRRMMVYLPPDYQAHPARRYPVLYLLHGGGEDERGWVDDGRAPEILDALIAAGTVRPMIVVMPNGNDDEVAAQGEALGPTPSNHQAHPVRLDPALFAVDAPTRPIAYEGSYPQSVVRDIIPFVDKAFRTVPDRAHRAIAGLSMGGTQTVVITNANPGTFDDIGVFSGGGMTENPTFQRQFAALAASKPRLYWGGAGDADIARLRMKALDEAARANGLPAKLVSMPGNHAWPLWRRFFRDFAPLLFR